MRFPTTIGPIAVAPTPSGESAITTGSIEGDASCYADSPTAYERTRYVFQRRALEQITLPHALVRSYRVINKRFFLAFALASAFSAPAFATLAPFVSLAFNFPAQRLVLWIRSDLVNP